MTPLIAGLGTTELLIIFGVIILLFGAAKLPELARGSGRALRIFKAETKGLMDDDEDDTTTSRPKPIERPTDVEPVEKPSTESDGARRSDPL
ncbi:twin-arginine translocase TatA/TatE family subunit [Nocardioides dongxiaopingii]|uniref:twin-arginine translocase TatA/TatE family subunit n=1 Tax=Nocardioides dongxiaopingii TaxID=2576036 RepID=UPI0010C7714C|nr:twin-arginine translocase TatA/TatE family subunit [Nocardioides dongxiaopingii]